MSAGERVEAITLDAAGTLIHVAEPVAETYARIAETAGARLSTPVLEAAFRDEFWRMPAMAFPGRSGAALLGAERDWWRRLVGRVVARAGGVGDFDTYFDALYGHYAQPSAWRVYGDVPEALTAVRARGLRLAVVSNFDSRLLGILRGLGLAERFDAIIYSTAVGSAKPDAGIFEHALAALEVSPRTALHVGDDAQADYHGARTAGLAALLVQRRRSPPAGDIAVIRSLSEIADHLPD
ncbi:MAG: HAD-IA family hydrolase [Gammaproteobacteria bacterium]|nr:HAD-IA family hydrolase [Gammaproteobacteria bacterium]